MRIIFIRPCCIGDVVMSTAALSALRDAYPQAHITIAVGGWSRHAIAYHPAVDAILDTGKSALPIYSLGRFRKFVQQLRAGNFDIAISLVRSPLMSLALLFSGIPTRAGIDSNGRGFGYTHKHRISPADTTPEAQIYLDTVATLGIPTQGYQINLPILEDARQHVQNTLASHSISRPYIVIHPGGGSNPGMLMHSKRYPPAQLAQIANALSAEYDAHIILIGADADQPITDALQAHLNTPATIFLNAFTFPQIGALAYDALLYLGNDTGLTHLAAASGAKTAMLLGPSDPRRYAPFTDNSIALWKPTTLNHGGVDSADTTQWDWSHDGIMPETALSELHAFLSP
ncbi:MAG: glycosyltransferase family 9 protein [Chloroflexota bacterium]